MRKRLIGGVLAGGLVATVGFGSAAGAAPPECNWGQLTKYAIQEIPGWDQGLHSADPSGDGLGPEARVGLPNLTGSMEDTCLLVKGLLP